MGRRREALEAEAAGDSVGPRLREEGREDLAAAGELRIDERRRRRARLEGRVERHLGLILVEQLLPPDFDRPALPRAAQAEAGIDQGIGVLPFLREEVGARIVV